jgi:flagellar biosynthesis protein FliQ
LISLTHPPTQGDALSYHAPLALFLWRDGNLTSFLTRAPDNFALAQPGATELWVGALRLVGGERLADLGQLPFALLAAAAVAAFSRRLGAGPGGARLAAGAILLVPMLIGQVGTQANDLSTAALATAVAALVVAPSREWTLSRAALVATAIGLIFASKLALLPAALVIAVFAAFAIREMRVAHRWMPAALAGVAFLLVVAPWWARDLIRYQNPLYPARIPIYGHGVDVAGLGAIDSQFVPSRVAWPLYPLAEPHDDRSGFGALLIVAGLPGLVAVALRTSRESVRRRPLSLLLGLTLVGLPAWWVFTLHEPRFLFLYAALVIACAPFALHAVPRNWRRAAAWLLVITACFSAIVTVDQVLLPYARQPSSRAAFYDRVWGVDPYVVSLPSNVGLLWDTGYGPGVSDYAAYYPLLGSTQRRLVVPIDIEPASRAVTATSARRLVARMRQMRVRYAYVQSVPQYRSLVNILYPRGEFRLVHLSAIAPGGNLGGRRHVYRDVPLATRGAIWRYLFRLTA